MFYKKMAIIKDGTTSPSPLVTREFPTDIGVSSQRINNIMSFDEKQLITTQWNPYKKLY
ncbi:hypothetical protein MHL86_13520 [Brevibacillus laterosporus]|nr:hypothetical protein [Brevibacillus laterosporus]